MIPSTYPYQFGKIQICNDNLKYLIQYQFKVNCMNSNKVLDYALNFYKYDKFLYITDYFPVKWENDSKCFQKLLSTEENISVNVKKIVTTCFMIFHERIIRINKNAGFVVSGSYVEGEKPLPGLNYSRKLKLYWLIFKPLVSALHYKIVEIFDYNAIVIIRNDCQISDEMIREKYLDFKNNVSNNRSNIVPEQNMH